MAGLKDPHLAQAYRLLHARGESTTTLAAKAFTSRAHVSQVLNGQQRRGRSWERIKAHLTPEEIALLEQVPQVRPPRRPPSMTPVALASRRYRARKARSSASAGTAVDGQTENISTRPANPTAGAFIHWKQQQRTA